MCLAVGALSILAGVGAGIRADHSHGGPPPTLASPAVPNRSHEISLSQWVDVAPGERQEFPDVAVDREGVTWVAWMSFEHASESDLREAIYLRAFRPDGSAGEPILLDNDDDEHGRGERFWPRIVTDGDDLWVTWCTHINGRWAVRGVARRNGELEAPRVLSSASRDAVRPAIGLDGVGRPWVAWEELRGATFAVVARPFEGHGPAVTVGEQGDMDLRPALAPAPGGGLWIAWDSYRDGRYSVWARPLSGQQLGEPVLLGDDDGWNLAPSLTVAPDDTLWVAWHSNFDPLTGRRTISQRLRIKAIQGDRILDPAIGQPPPVQASLGGQLLQVEDTVEFVNLVADAHGRLWLTARRGQGFFGLMGDGEGWHGPYNLARLGWGGRGRDLRLAVAPDGSVQTVARRMHRVALQLLQPPRSVPPSPVRVSTTDGGSLYFATSKLPGPSADRFEPPRVRRDRFAREVAALEQGTAADAPLDLGAQLAPAALLASTAGEGGDGDSAFERTGAALRTVPDAPIERHPQRTEHLLLGDLHTHSWHSDGTGDPDQIFTRSRDERGLDFVALTDHDISNGNILSPSEFAYLQLMSDFFNQPGQFVTLKSYEWTSNNIGHGGAGHKNIYFPGDDAHFYGYGSGVNDTVTLFDHLRDDGALAIPHHIGWTGTDWENHDPAVQPDVEIVSVHGAFEYPNNQPIAPRANLPGMFVRDGLLRGLRFGLVGGSDGHGVAWHYGVSRKEDPWSTGLTGIYTEDFERGGIIEALRGRRCYATSGTPILLYLQANGSRMGREIQATDSVSLVLKVNGSAPLSSVVVIKDGQELRALSPSGQTFDAQIVDTQLDRGEHFYYVRAVQVDGEVAWSSPVFVTVTTPPLEASVVRSASP